MNESNQKDIQQSGEKLVGIGGWLALFIFVSKWINPPYAMLSILQTYFIVESANQYSPNEKMIYIVLLSVFTLAVTYLQFKYATEMTKNFTPEPIEKMKSLIIKGIVIGYIINMLFNFNIEGFLIITVGTLILSIPIICYFGYFKKSKRVKNTYYSNE